MNKLLLAGSLLLSTQHIEGLRLFKDLIKNKKALQVKKTGCSKVMPNCPRVTPMWCQSDKKVSQSGPK